MPVHHGAGYSRHTYLKMMIFTKLVERHLAVTDKVLKKYWKTYRQTYRYVDLTAGPGCHPNGVVGSPINFLRCVYKLKASGGFTHLYRADFVECVPVNLAELERNITREAANNGWPVRWIFHAGKYETEVHNLFPAKDEGELGLVFVDPTGNLPDFEVALNYVAMMRPKMEILIHLSSTNVKRVKQYTNKRLDDYIKAVGKKYWSLRSPRSGDQFKWTFLLGSSTDVFKDYPGINLVRMDSAKGQEILEKLVLTEAEQQVAHQGKLFEF